MTPKPALFTPPFHDRVAIPFFNMSIHLVKCVILGTGERKFLKGTEKHFYVKARKDKIMDVEHIFFLFSFMYVLKVLVGNMVLPCVNERHLAENAGL